MPFTDKQIRALKPKQARYERHDPGRTGLSIRVTPRGVKTWALRYRFNDAHRRVVLGNYPKMGVASAHKAVADAREKLLAGIDPGAVMAKKREVERNAETIADLANEYLERYARKKKRSAGQDERTLNTEIVPVIGTMKAGDVTRRDITLLLDGIEDRGSPVMRNRTASLISKMFMFGLDRGIVTASPAVGIARLKETPRDVILRPEQIRTFWAGLDAAQMDPRTALALKFALVSGQRRSEIAGIERTEIDDDEQLWTLPGERTKNGKPNFIPLPPLAMSIVEEADKLRVKPSPSRPDRKDRPAYDPTPSPWLFPSTQGRKPLEPAALTRAVNRNREALGIDNATVHDLRRSFATWHGEIGTAPEILGALLNHTPKEITARVYNRASNIEPKRRAMERWCDWLELVIAGEFDAAEAMQGAEVVEISPRAASHAG